MRVIRSDEIGLDQDNLETRSWGMLTSTGPFGPEEQLTLGC